MNPTPPLCVPGTTSGPSAEIQELALKLKTWSPAEQHAFVQNLVVRMEAGDAQAKATLEGLASLKEVVATPQGGTQPDVAEVVLAQLPRLGARIAASAGIPGANVAVMVHDIAKIITQGKIDFERWFSRTVMELGNCAEEAFGRGVSFKRLAEGATCVGDAALWIAKEYAEGVKALFIDAPISFVKDIWRILNGQEAVGWAAFLLNPLASLPLVRDVLRFFAAVLGSAPCEWTKKSKCQSYELWDNRKFGRGTCCNPAPSGIGVLFAQHKDGYKKFPGRAIEMPAGDYIAASGERAAELPTVVEGQPNFALGMSDASSALVPPGYKVRLFSKEMFEGTMHELGPGTHDLHALGLGDKVRSAQIRGAWTIFDYTYGQNLMAQKTGWVTSYMERRPTEKEVKSLVLNDPQRNRDHEDFGGLMIRGTPTWAPDWATQLEKVGILNHPIALDTLKKLGVRESDIEASQLVNRFLTTSGPNVPLAVVAGDVHRFR